MYNQLIDIGYKQHEIDQLDFVHHMELLGRRKQEKETVADDDKLYIDDLGV